MNECISVIIPVYNFDVAYLKRCVDSVKNQTYPEVEIIVIDDNSDEKYSLEYRKLYEQDSAVRFIKIPHAGVSGARNKGLEEARGKYITFVDADDTVDRELFEMLYDNMMEFSAELSGCDMDKTAGTNIYTKADRVVYKGDKLRSAVFARTELRGYCCRKLFFKSVIDKYSLRFPENIGIAEDTVFVYSYCLHINVGVLDRRPLYHYTYNATGAMRGGNLKLHITGLKAFEKMLEYGRAHGVEPPEEFYCECVSLCLNVVRQMARNKKYDKAAADKINKILRKNYKLYISHKNNNTLSERIQATIGKYGTQYLYFAFRLKHKLLG